jgi:hypothetical protein
MKNLIYIYIYIFFNENIFKCFLPGKLGSLVLSYAFNEIINTPVDSAPPRFLWGDKHTKSTSDKPF